VLEPPTIGDVFGGPLSSPSEDIVYMTRPSIMDNNSEIGRRQKCRDTKGTDK
jgi:hypothetical protein